MECGKNGAPEPSSKRKSLANVMQVSRDERERRNARSEGERADRQPEERSNPHAGHGVNGVCEVVKSGPET